MSYINAFAATDFRNQRKRFGIEREDRRLGCYIIGRTGMGKSSLLVNMALNDAVHNEGFCFIDPHGDAVERLRDSLPASRASDTIYFDPAGQDPPIGLNLLETVGPEHRHLVVSGLISIFTALYGPQYFQHRQVHVLRNTLIALLELDAPQTLVDVYHLLTDWRFRKYVVARIKDPLVKSFWQKEFPKYVFSRGEGIAPLLNKFGSFLTTPMIRGIIGQSSSGIRFRSLMDQGGILLCNLSKGRMGEDNSAFLGALLILKLQLAALSRADTPEHKRRDFFAFVDEAHSFLGGGAELMDQLTAESRKHRVSWTFANQYLVNWTTN